MKEVKCAFCEGKGIDPFKLLSPSSTCSVCGGKGEVNVEEPYIKCAFCHGTRVYPHTRLNRTICSGKGVVTFKEPRMTCPQCKGTGREPLSDFPCIRCGGIGVIRKSPGSIGENEISPGQAGKKPEKLHEACALRVANPENPV
jgi:DnaJ-class molecular chaperone